MNGALAVSRYTLIEISRRRLLLVFFAIGAVGIGGLGILLKVFTSAFVGSASFGGPPGSGPTAAQMEKLTELSFVSNLIGVLGLFALLIAFAIGMTAIYHDLESGAAVAIFSKPVSRFAFTVGKLVAAVVAMIAIDPRRLQLTTTLLIVAVWPALALWRSYRAKGMTSDFSPLSTAATDGVRASENGAQR